MIGYVIIGGALGALARFVTERWSVHRFGERVPYGTFIVNAAGSLLLGIAVGLHEQDVMNDGVLLLIGTGFCGSLTTFSGWIGQIYTRGRHNDTRWLAAVYLFASVTVGVVLAFIGHAIV